MAAGVTHSVMQGLTLMWMHVNFCVPQVTLAALRMKADQPFILKIMDHFRILRRLQDD